MAKPYFLCGYGHVARISERTDDAQKAARDCFGVTGRVTCLRISGKSWKYLNHATKQNYLQQLKKLHKEKTGSDLEI